VLLRKRTAHFRRPLGEDAYTYKLQIEGFADTILRGKPQHGATVDGWRRGDACDGGGSLGSVESREAVKLSDVNGGV
jgi:hypothetical protein